MGNTLSRNLKAVKLVQNGGDLSLTQGDMVLCMNKISFCPCCDRKPFAFQSENSVQDLGFESQLHIMK